MAFVLFRNLQYIERDGNEFLYTLQAYPDWLQKKITLLKYFRDYMSQHLLKVIHLTLILKCEIIFINDNIQEGERGAVWLGSLPLLLDYLCCSGGPGLNPARYFFI